MTVWCRSSRYTLLLSDSPRCQSRCTSPITSITLNLSSRLMASSPLSLPLPPFALHRSVFRFLSVSFSPPLLSGCRKHFLNLSKSHYERIAGHLTPNLFLLDRDVWASWRWTCKWLNRCLVDWEAAPMYTNNICWSRCKLKRISGTSPGKSTLVLSLLTSNKATGTIWEQQDLCHADYLHVTRLTLMFRVNRLWKAALVRFVLLFQESDSESGF